MKLNKEDKLRLGYKIKELRLEKGMTTKEFGKLFGATDSNVTSWEKGRTSPNPERLKAIAKVADITVEELLSNSKKDYAIEYAMNRLKNILYSESNLDIDIMLSDFVYKYGEKILSKIEENFKLSILSMYSNKDIENYIDEIINVIIYDTPKGTKELLLDIQRTLSKEINKISEYNGETQKYSFYINISDELNSETVKKAVSILNNTIKEIEALMKDCD